MNDLKFAVRQLLENPGFTAVAVFTRSLEIRLPLCRRFRTEEETPENGGGVVLNGRCRRDRFESDTSILNRPFRPGGRSDEDTVVSRRTVQHAGFVSVAHKLLGSVAFT